MKKSAKVGICRKAAVFLMAMLLAICSLVGCSKEQTNSGGGGGSGVLPAIPAGGCRVAVYYWRPDNTYENWDLWMWKVGAEGAGYAFNQTVSIGGSNWVLATATFDSLPNDPGGDAFGVIARKGGNSWAGKDVDMNLFAPQSAIVDGSLSIYMVSGDTTLYFNQQDAIAGMKDSTKKKISYATFTKVDTVFCSFSDKITDKSFFKVKDQSGAVVAEYDCSLAANSSSIGKKFLNIKLPSGTKYDPTKIYVVEDAPATFSETANFVKTPQIVPTGVFATQEFDDAYGYDGELGAIYSAAQTEFKVWSPYATAMKVNIYAAGEGGEATSYDMTKGEKAVWSYTLAGDQKNKYYTYTVINSNVNTTAEVVDPYARSGGRNGKRGMIVDLDSTDPTGWDEQSNPTLASNSQAVIYEAQLRDLTIHSSSGVTAANRGKFLGLTEIGTKNNYGESTALDYIKDLGVTQIHFQPLFDFASVNENFNEATYNKDGEYNWGYDPLNYNMPDGSYSSDPADGTKRVNEMKQMVQALHNAGIQIVMDVVYNHVSDAQQSNFQQLMPYYYFRMTNNGTFYNGSGCGNETASERYMFRKFMIDSVKYWTQEYKIDGFRFDLMGLHDITTMNAIYDQVSAINSDVIMYGEGWTGGTSGLITGQAVLANAKETPNIAYFNDKIRDGLKGSYDKIAGTGYIQGKANSDNEVYIGAKGVCGSDLANPTQSIAYVACHDNSLLWDKLNASANKDAATLKGMNRLAAAAVFTSQGISFIPAGEEMLRSKPTTKDNKYDNRPNKYITDENYWFSDNSYRSPDSVNAIDWDLLHTNADMVAYYKQLIAIKKTFAQFHITTKAQVDECVIVNKETAAGDGVAIFAVKDPDSNEYAIVILNNNSAAKNVAVPQGEYSVYVNGASANAATALSTITGNSVQVGAHSAVVMKATLDSAAIAGWTYGVTAVAAA